MTRNNQVSVGLLFVGLLLVSCAGSGTTVPLPDGMVGRWETQAEAYADRSFELSATTIVLGTGDGTYARSAISRVSRVSDENGVRYIIEYVNAAGERSSMRVHFDAATGAIRFYNQPELVWRKVES